jgi:peptidoglycan hydrolase-like protein with peptidoglycan-binding domain
MSTASQFVTGGHNGLGDFSPGQRTLKNTGKPYMQGADVKFVQRIVGVKVDGAYGPRTQAAVKHFQRQNGLNVTGTVDSATWKSLRESATILEQVETTVDNYFDIVQSTDKGEVPKNWLTTTGSESGNQEKHIKKWVWWAGGSMLGIGLLGMLLTGRD